MAPEKLETAVTDDVVHELLAFAQGDAPEELRGQALLALAPVLTKCFVDYVDLKDDLEITPEEDLPISSDTFEMILAEGRRLYSDPAQPKLIRRRAFEMTARNPEDWHRPEIRKHYASSDLDWKITALAAMAHVGGFTKEIAETIAHADGPLLLEALRAAQDMVVWAAARDVRQLAQSERTPLDVRVAAICALWPTDKDPSDLLERLERHHDERIAEAARVTLKELRDEQEEFG